jgi:hypothetical protein
MYQPRSVISVGALESIREFMASCNRAVTIEQVASIYPEVVTWVRDKHSRTESWNWRKEAMSWARVHLEHMNRKSGRTVQRDGLLWRLASVKA